MFRTVPLSIIRSFPLYTQQWYTSYEYADSLRAVSKPVWHIPLLCVQWKTPDDGQMNCPKHVEFHSKIKFWEISASSWFYYKKYFLQVLWAELCMYLPYRPCVQTRGPSHITQFYLPRTSG